MDLLVETVAKNRSSLLQFTEELQPVKAAKSFAMTDIKHGVQQIKMMFAKLTTRLDGAVDDPFAVMLRDFKVENASVLQKMVTSLATAVANVDLLALHFAEVYPNIPIFCSFVLFL